MAERCPSGHEMTVRERFRFDHEPGDSPRDTESLQLFEAMGIELGAEVTLWYCELCDFASGQFVYPDKERPCDASIRRP